MKLKRSVKYMLVIDTDVYQKDMNMETPPKSTERTCNSEDSSPVCAGRWGASGAARIPQKSTKCQRFFSTSQNTITCLPENKQITPHP